MDSTKNGTNALKPEASAKIGNWILNKTLAHSIRFILVKQIHTKFFTISLQCKALNTVGLLIMDLKNLGTPKNHTFKSPHFKW